MLTAEQFNQLATKDYIKDYLDEKLTHFATKDYLDEKLTNFATKDDLKNFATKDDLKPLATKFDLKMLDYKLEQSFDHLYSKLDKINDHEFRLNKLELRML